MPIINFDAPVRMSVLPDHRAWLDNRKRGLGGSDIAASVGLNPYKSNVELWREKTGRTKPEDISGKAYVEYGTKAEKYLRELFALDFPQFVVEHEENNSFVNANYPWAVASLDGWLLDEHGRLGVWECKTTNIKRAAQRGQWENRVPMHYYCQCLLYMEVIGAEFCVLKAQLKSMVDSLPQLQIKHYIIERTDVQDDIDWLMQKGAEFWGNVQNDICPALILPEI